MHFLRKKSATVHTVYCNIELQLLHKSQYFKKEKSQIYINRKNFFYNINTGGLWQFPALIYSPDLVPLKDISFG